MPLSEAATKDVLGNTVKDYILNNRSGGYSDKQWSKESVKSFRKRIVSIPELVLDETNKPFSVPVDFDIQDLADLGIKPLDIPSALSFLSLVHYICAYKGVFRKERAYAQIHSQYIRKRITDMEERAKGMIDKLISVGLIERDNVYQVGIRSTGYRLGERNKDSQWETKDFGEYLLSLPDEVCSKKVNKLALWNRAAQYFTDWRNLEEGKTKETCRATEKIIAECKIIITDELGRKLDLAAIAKAEIYKKDRIKRNLPVLWSAADVRQTYDNALSAFNSDDAHISIDPRTNRLYSVVTFVKREARAEIQLRGQSLISLDIKSCQVCLLSSFYQDNALDKAEKEKFIRIITDEDIYTFLSSEEVPRDVAKVEAFKIMFAKIWQHTGKFWDNFSSLFPILAQRITDIKISRGFRAVSRAMQSLEAKIMITGCLDYLLKEKKLEVLTCHDSVMCLPQDVEVCRAAMIRFFSQEMEFDPVVKES